MSTCQYWTPVLKNYPFTVSGGMKKENMQKLNLACSEADHKQPKDRTVEDKDIFINTKKEFRERKSYELPWLQELLPPKKNWNPGI